VKRKDHFKKPSPSCLKGKDFYHERTPCALSAASASSPLFAPLRENWANRVALPKKWLTTPLLGLFVLRNAKNPILLDEIQVEFILA